MTLLGSRSPPATPSCGSAIAAIGPPLVRGTGAADLQLAGDADRSRSRRTAASVSRSALRAGSKATQHLAGGRTHARRAARTPHRSRGRPRSVASPRTAEPRARAARPLERRGTVVDRIELRYVDALHCAGSDARRARAPAPNGPRPPRGVPRDARRGRAARHGLGPRRRPVAARRCRSPPPAARPADILAWAERLRGNALRLPADRLPQIGKRRAAAASSGRSTVRCSSRKGRQAGPRARLAPRRARGERQRSRARLKRSRAEWPRRASSTSSRRPARSATARSSSTSSSTDGSMP